METPIISVITICYNAEKEIERTMRSVLNQSLPNLEYIIIDGASRDGTLEIINQVASEYSSRDIKIISEPDRGIYDAMNKGIRKASGEWLNMMNAGDVFAGDDVLERVFEYPISVEHSFLYGDTNIMSNNHIRYKLNCSYKDGRLLHQSCIYKKYLHAELGLYRVTRPIIISDYIFFMSVPSSAYCKLPFVVSNYDGGGISQGVWSALQKCCVDYVYNRCTFWQLIKDLLLLKMKSIGKLGLSKLGYKI